jgi:multiple sugar transport system permease protein
MENNITLNYRSTRTVGHIVIYIFLIITAFTMLIPFAWMLSSSLKLNKDVFAFPMQWIPRAPRWQNYSDIWR